MNDYRELERLAEAATPGPWSFDGSYVCPARVEDGATYVETWRSVADCHQPENTKFIAAANPAAVLALIAENKAMAEFREHMVQLRETHGFDSWAAALVEVDRLRAENIALTKTTGAAMFLTLTDGLAELRKKLTAVHFVCDRLPDQDGCRFIELESPQGESLGDESGKWEIRPDGLAQLVVEIASPDIKHMAAQLECAQGDLKQAMQIIEKDAKDAERYRFLRRTDSWGDIDFEDHGLWIVNARDEVINQDGVKLDAAVDAAMSKESDHDQP